MLSKTYASYTLLEEPTKKCEGTSPSGFRSRDIHARGYFGCPVRIFLVQARTQKPANSKEEGIEGVLCEDIFSAGQISEL